MWLHVGACGSPLSYLRESVYVTAVSKAGVTTGQGGQLPWGPEPPGDPKAPSAIWCWVGSVQQV